MAQCRKNFKGVEPKSTDLQHIDRTQPDMLNSNQPKLTIKTFDQPGPNALGDYISSFCSNQYFSLYLNPKHYIINPSCIHTQPISNSLI